MLNGNAAATDIYSSIAELLPQEEKGSIEATGTLSLGR